ncbi:MAG: glycosyltransferase [Christensenellales bacterium]
MNKISVSNEETKKLKIGFFIDTFFPMVDGVIMVVDNYARRLNEIADVTVFTTKTRKNFDDSSLPYKVVRCPMFPVYGLDYDLPLPNLSRKFKKQIENSNLDIIHIHSPFGVGKIGMQYAKMHHIPVAATMHSQYKKDFLKETHNWKWLSNILLKKIMKVFNNCDECWAVNRNVSEIYFNEYGAKALPQVHNNGTDLKYLSDTSFISELKEKYKINSDEKVFLFVGRLTVLKNILFIVKSLKLVKEKGLKFKMLFVGTGPDELKLKNLIKELHLKKDILILGKITNRKEISKLYSLADLFLFPSLYDCSSLVQIEASSQKTPTLFLEEAATADAVNHNVNGYLSKNSEEDYANTIIDIFKDETKYKNVCEKAFKDLYLTWDDAVSRALKDYTRLINSKNENPNKKTN